MEIVFVIAIALRSGEVAIFVILFLYGCRRRFR